jgi:DNA-binding transcriptional MerR regulator
VAADGTPERVRDARGKYIYTPESAERDARAADLRAEGWTLQQIADHLGYQDRTAVRRGIQQALKAIVKAPAEKLLQQEATRLDSLYEEALEILQRDHVMVSHGRVVYGDDGQPLRDDGPKLQAIDRLVKVRESYRKLLGLDQPTKVQVSGGVKYEVVGVDPEDLT